MPKFILQSLSLAVGAACVALASVIAPASANVLADFDGVTPTIAAPAGNLFNTNAIGDRRCRLFSVGASNASGNAFCGGGGEAVLTAAIPNGSALLEFSLAASTVNRGGADFEGPTSPSGIDAIDVTIGATTILSLQGVGETGGLEVLAISDAVLSPLALGAQLAASGVFQDFVVDLSGLSGDLSVRMSSDGRRELLGFDSASVSAAALAPAGPAPAMSEPPALLAIAGGALCLAALARRRG